MLQSEKCVDQIFLDRCVGLQIGMKIKSFKIKGGVEIGYNGE